MIPAGVRGKSRVPGTGGQDVEIVKQDPSGADVECVTNKTLVLVLSSWLVGVDLRNAR